MGNFSARFLKAFHKNKSAPPVPPPSEATFAIGTVIDGRYRLDMELGRGGLGIVYRAHDIPNRRDVAIKVINGRTANALTLQQFAREAEITAQLTHPHIVTVYETGAVDTGAGQPSPFIVMELVQGKSLDEVHSFTYAVILDIAKQICDALAYTHERGFVYRDLKPANVILEKRGFHYFVKLLDFGLARTRGEAYRSHESNLAGTVFYLAPELIAGQPADIGSDLYALGVLLYELLTGRVPFSNVDEQTVLSQHLHETVSPPSHSRADVPPALESIVLRLLEKDPKDRFPSALEVCHALEQVKLDPGTSQGNLPQVHFSGLENEIGSVIHMLESNRVVTLSNGNESLVLAVAQQLNDQFSNGAWLAHLEPVSEPAKVLKTVASILGVRENPDRPLTVSLIESLREKNTLLLLVHCDHVCGACKQLVETIIRSCPEVYFLTTSDQPLNVSGEVLYR